jgi:outer membrane protein assembly factor BamB
VIGTDGTLYVRDTINYEIVILAINATGDIQWRYKVVIMALQSSDLVTKFPFLGADKVIYMVNNHKVLALNITGNLLWTFTGKYALAGSPALGSDGTISVTGQKIYIHIMFSPKLSIVAGPLSGYLLGMLGIKMLMLVL